MIKPQTVIHIGANKTASTLLQRQLFSKKSHIQYFGEDCINYEYLKEDIHNMIHEDNFYFKKNFMISNSIRNTSSDITRIVFSNEDIMGSRHPSLAADRLKEIFPEAKILMVIRNQIDVFPSWYVNHGAYLKNVPRRFWRRYVSFDDWLEYCFNFPKISPVQAMNYLKYFQIFSKKFGEKNIIVIPYEDIFFDNSSFCNKLSELFDVESATIKNIFSKKNERSRNSKLNHEIHKFFGFSYKISNNIYKKISRFDNTGPFKISINNKWLKKINHEYADSNSELELKTGLNLKKYNYPHR